MKPTSQRRARTPSRQPQVRGLFQAGAPDSMRNRMSLMVLVIISMALMVNGLVLVLVQQQQYKEFTISKAFMAADFLRFKLDRLMSLGLYLNQMNGFDEECRDLLRLYPDIQEAFVVDHYGNVLYGSRERKGGKGVFALPDHVRDPGVPRHHSSNVLEQGELVQVLEPVFCTSQPSMYAGSVVVVYPARVAYDFLWSLGRTGVLVGLAVILVLVLLFRVLLKGLVERPIVAMVEAIRLARDGEQPPRLDHPDIQSSLELRAIADAFMSLYGRLEDQKRTIEDHSRNLESMVAQRTAELELSNRTVSENLAALQVLREHEARLQQDLERSRKMEAVGNLASGVAHDLNNILSGFVNYPELMLMEIDDDSPLVPHIKAIRQAGERAAGMVQDLMTLARRGVALAVPVSLDALLRDFRASPECLSLAARYPRIELEILGDGTLGNVSGVPFHLTKALMNLIQNAMEAIVGEGRVTVSASRVSLTAPVQGYETIPAGDYIRLQVADTGVGMDAATISRIFEPFFTKKVLGRRSGTGLGMSVVYSTVKEHQGYIDVASIPGLGSTISLYLLPSSESLPARPAEVPLQELAGRGQLVMVVDDLQEQRSLMRQMLERLAYRVVDFAGGEAALAWLEAGPAVEPELVLLDMIMDPGMDGRATFDRLAVLRPRLPVIMVSGYAEADAVKDLQDRGLAGFLTKPCRIELLGLAVRDRLGQGD